MQIEPFLKDLSHICWSTDDLKRKMGREIRMEPFAIFVKADIKEYYPDAEHEVLVNNSFRHVADDNLKQVLKDCLACLLDTQFIWCSELAVGSKANRGSGQGLIHSGPTCDASFFWVGDSQVLGNDNIRMFYR